MGGKMGDRLVKLIKKKTKYNNLKIHTVDNKKKIKAKTFSDSFHRVSKPSSKNYLKEINKIIQKKKINIIIPGSDEEAEFFSKKKKYFLKKNIFVNVNTFDDYKKFINKEKFYRKLFAANLITKYWGAVKSKKNLKSKLNYFKKKKIEFILKPSKSRGGRNVYIFDKNIKKIFYTNFKREKHIPFTMIDKTRFKFSKKDFPIIIMKKLFEPSFDIDILCNKGKLLRHVVRERLGAQGINGNIVKKNNFIFEKLSKKIARIFNLSGLYDLDVMLDVADFPNVIELNPRISGSISSSVQAGHNLIDDLISLSKGKKILKKSVSKEILIKR